MVRLILINVAVFIGLLLIYLILLPIGGSGNGATILRDMYVVQWLRSTADLGTLITRPWTAFTYMFVDTGLGQLFWSMILQWFGGGLRIRQPPGRRPVAVCDGGQRRNLPSGRGGEGGLGHGPPVRRFGLSADTGAG